MILNFVKHIYISKLAFCNRNREIQSFILQVRGGFITRPIQIAHHVNETEPLQEESFKTQINVSQLNQSRIGLLSQALMLIIISGFLFSETLSEFWKTKVCYHCAIVWKICLIKSNDRNQTITKVSNCIKDKIQSSF